MSLLCGSLDPAKCGCVVFFDAEISRIHHPEIELRFGVSPFSRLIQANGVELRDESRCCECETKHHGKSSLEQAAVSRRHKSPRLFAPTHEDAYDSFC